MFVAKLVEAPVPHPQLLQALSVTSLRSSKVTWRREVVIAPGDEASSVPLIPTLQPHPPSNDHTHTHNNKLSAILSLQTRANVTKPLQTRGPLTAITFSRAHGPLRVNGEFGDDDESLATTTETGGCAGSRQHRTHTRPHTFPSGLVYLGRLPWPCLLVGC